ncbi:MAG: TatD family hydrolase [Bacteroidota bacterium]
MLIDTHAHLYLPQFQADRPAILARAREAGVGMILMPAVDLASVHTALDLAENTSTPDLRAMAGIHPSYVHEMAEADLNAIADLARDERIVAVGETGLDYYWTRDHIDAQKESLRAHARLAMETGLPIVLHNRDKKGSDECSQDLLRILREARDTHEGMLTGVFHCFSGPEWLAAEVLDLGFYLGLGGTLTFKNGGVPEAIGEVPLDRLVLETDAPYLAPTPHRGKRNEPSYVRLVAERLALLRGQSVEEIEEATSANARALFSL